MSVLSCARFSSTCKPCVMESYPANQREVPVCLRQMAGCNAYVSAHERTLLPMGTLANGDLRHKRILAHRALKKLQQDCHMENGRSISGCKPNWGLMHTRPTSASFPNICVSKSFPSVSRLRRTHPACCLNGGEA